MASKLCPRCRTTGFGGCMREDCPMRPAVPQYDTPAEQADSENRKLAIELAGQLQQLPHPAMYRIGLPDGRLVTVLVERGSDRTFDIYYDPKDLS